jgi:DNA-binding winged helix-turn-helix (wHTH) protein
MTFKSILAIAAALVLIVSWTVIREEKPYSSYDKEKEMIMMRDIGHHVLLFAGDSSSRVLPVKQTGEHEYVLQFENQFTFIPDSLVAVIDRTVKAHHLSPNYMAEVISCASQEVIFGFAIQADSTANIVPCLGREQVKACYRIKLIFPATAPAKEPWLLTGSLLAIALSLLARYLYTRHKKAIKTIEAVDPPPADSITEQSTPITIGRYLFYAEKQLLLFEQESIPLTAKESKVLQVFAGTPNEVIDRNRLLKEVWEDEGVIVGRSLDMFVSKLRKKLQQDPGIRITNVHGKGYKLEVNA